MNKRAVRTAVEEARRFIAKAEKVLARDFQAETADDESLWRSPETAATSRASLDLTRALAEMRRFS